MCRYATFPNRIYFLSFFTMKFYTRDITGCKIDISFSCTTGDVSFCRRFDPDVKYITNRLFSCVWTLLLMTSGWCWEITTTSIKDKTCAIISKWTSSSHWLLETCCINSQSRWWRVVCFAFYNCLVSYLAWIAKRIVSKMIAVYIAPNYVPNSSLISFDIRFPS